MSQKKRYHVHLREEERDALHQFVGCGTKNARAITRARILLLADAERSDQEIITVLGVSRPTVWAVRKRYAERDETPLLGVISDAPRTGRPITIDSRVEAHISLIACSEAPEGRARWTLHMIADKLVQLAVIQSISHERVRTALKKTH